LFTELEEQFEKFSLELNGQSKAALVLEMR